MGDSHAFPTAELREDSRGQLVEYGKELCSRQHRNFALEITVYKQDARFILFDRAGAVLSESFDYIKHPKFFYQFVYRYLNATRQGRGFDPTATRATGDECAQFLSLASRFPRDSYAARALNKAATPGWPIHKLSILAPWSVDSEPLQDDPGPTRSKRDFLVGRPLHRAFYMTCRGTQGYVAWDITRQAVVFLKDYWRMGDISGELTEYEVYMRLGRLKRVDENFPVLTLLGGGDVLFAEDDDQLQESVSNVCWTDQPGALVQRRVHVRFVFKELCRPLHTFEDAYQLVSLMRDALYAHQQAWDHVDVGILHRDLSEGNILIYDKPDPSNPSELKAIGLLSDWDLAKTKARVEAPVASQMSCSVRRRWLSLSVIVEICAPPRECVSVRHLRYATLGSRAPP
ncbi:hypothetical protein BD413DRAFT_691692 [Trametes elegans]|nr:hypothetical protein BD413DRAFT_691692 [Trametes elegans]